MHLKNFSRRRGGWQIIRLLLVAILLLSTVACSTWKPFRGSFEEEKSLIFGYIDMSDAPSNFKWLNAKRIKPTSDTPYYGFFVDHGLFYRTYIPEGVYKLQDFGGFSWRYGGTEVAYNFPTQGKNVWDPLIKVPGIYYLGSYKYKKAKSSFMNAKYDLVQIKSPGEKELLQRLLKLAVHPTWKNKIEKRIKEIKS